MDRAEDLNYIGSYVRSVGRDINERCKADKLVWKALRVETKLRVFKAMVEPGLSL